jgi:hypothetical protein
MVRAGLARSVFARQPEPRPGLELAEEFDAVDGIADRLAQFLCAAVVAPRPFEITRERKSPRRKRFGERQIEILEPAPAGRGCPGQIQNALCMPQRETAPPRIDCGPCDHPLTALIVDRLADLTPQTVAPFRRSDHRVVFRGTPRALLEKTPGLGERGDRSPANLT